MEVQSMDDQVVRKSRKPIIVRNAILFVMLLIAIMLGAHFAGDVIPISTTQIALIEYVLLLFAVLFTQLEVRAKIFDGLMPFNRAFSTGVIFVLIVMATFSVFTLIFYLFIAPEILSEMITIAENSLKSQGYTGEDLEDRMTFTRRIFTPFGMFLISLIGYLFFGLIMSLIASIFTQRTN